MALSLEVALVLGVYLASIIYGAFVVLFILSVYFWLKRPAPRPLFTLLTSCALLLLNTLYMGIQISYVCEGLTAGTDQQAYFGLVADWKEVLAPILSVVMVLLADSILIYRCWIVWGKNWRVIVFPCILLCGGLATATVGFYKRSTVATSTASTTVYSSKLSLWMEVTIAYTLVQNVIVIGLIIFRIWHIHRSATHAGGSRLSPINYAILESGLLYVSIILIWLVTYVAGTTGFYVPLNCIGPVTGVTFTLLLVRIGLHGATGMTTHPDEGTTAVPMRPITISVHRRVDMEERGYGGEAKDRDENEEGDDESASRVKDRASRTMSSIRL